jgi:RNA polymerase sigma-70 factor (ECF subfamily)
VTHAPADGDPRVRVALARLSVRDQEILLLVAWDGLDRAGIARVLGCSNAVVRLRLHRARQRFAEAYAAIGSKPAKGVHDIEEGISHV